MRVVCFALLIVCGVAQVQASPEIDRLLATGRFEQAAELAQQTPDHYLHTLLVQAKQMHLHDDPTWHTLIVYKKNMWGGLLSLVDDPNFFLAQNGHRDAWLEMAATLAAFFSGHAIKPTNFQAQCRFPARYFWLSRQLHFDPQRLTLAPCNDFNTIFQFVKPAAITVIFPATHPNSPSSMFGHTLMRFDKAGRKESERMLDYSVSYAAQIDPDVSKLNYAVLGLSGGFPGKFSFLPYYAKLREYSEMENRDLWEFTLNLKQSDVEFIFRHAYELGSTYFKYYFFTENCSYHVFSLLDLAFPEHKLTDQVRPWIIPIDTIKILDKQGLIQQARFYPSLARKIQNRMLTLDRDDVRLTVRAYEKGMQASIPAIESLPEKRRATVLDLLGNLFQYRRFKVQEKVTPKMSPPERAVLKMRSRIHVQSPLPHVAAPDIRPDRGHDTARLSIGGEHIDDRHYTDLDWRPAYHDVLDSSQGFTSYSGLQFLRTTVRYDEEKQRLKLHELSVFDIFSAEPRNRIFRNTSWHVQFNYRRVQDADNQWRSSVNIDGGGGLTYRLIPNHNNIWFAFIDGDLRQGELFNKGYSIAPGIRSGFILEPLSGWRLLAQARVVKGIAGEQSPHGYARIGQSFAVNHRFNLHVFAQQEKFLGQFRRHYGVELRFYH